MDRGELWVSEAILDGLGRAELFRVHVGGGLAADWFLVFEDPVGSEGANKEDGRGDKASDADEDTSAEINHLVESRPSGEGNDEEPWEGDGENVCDPRFFNDFVFHEGVADHDGEHRDSGDIVGEGEDINGGDG